MHRPVVCSCWSRRDRGGGTTLSAEVNSALRAEVARRERQQALAELLDRLAEERGGLDSPEAEAVSALLDPRHPSERKVRRAMEAARRLRRVVAIATGTLAELYRGAGRNQALDALLARESGIGLLLRDTYRSLARLN